MSYFSEAKELIQHAEAKVPNVEKAYQNSLNKKLIDTVLLIDIKNITENLRSALDFAAHGPFDKYGSSRQPNPRIYFPYAPKKTCGEKSRGNLAE